MTPLNSTSSRRPSTPTWVWGVIAVIVATLTVACLLYIGWFDNETHVDSPNGDNVTQQYNLTEPRADEPGEADWQNADKRSLQEVIVDPDEASSSAE